PSFDQFNYSHFEVHQPPIYPTLTQNPYYVSLPPISEAACNDTAQLVEKLKEIALGVLPRTQRPLSYQERISPPASPLIFDFSRRENNFFSRREVNYYPASQSAYPTAEKKERDDRAIGIAGVIILAVSAYFLGKLEARKEEAEGDRASFEALKNKWFVNKAAYQAHCSPIVKLIDESIAKADAIFARQKQDSSRYTAQLLATFATGALFVSGACMGSSALITSGFAAAAATVVFSAYEYGRSHFSKFNQKQAEAIENNMLALGNS
ncbi:MAG: hypothetical protein LW832_00515, partial [Parachlamydia sp.]|nr:hypothetical protein [Parachlamydia sp.]